MISALGKGDDMVIDIINKEAFGVSEEVLNEVLNYMLFLKSKENENKKTKRKAGIYKGMFKVGDDFDEPLEDFLEYM